MGQFFLSRKALEDLKDIARYTQNTWGRLQRNRYLGELDEAFHMLASQPTLGRPCPEIRAGYRQHRVGEHLVFYRHCTKQDIEISRILHRRMNVTSHL